MKKRNKKIKVVIKSVDIYQEINQVSFKKSLANLLGFYQIKKSAK